MCVYVILHIDKMRRVLYIFHRIIPFNLLIIRITIKDANFR